MGYVMAERLCCSCYKYFLPYLIISHCYATLTLKGTIALPRPEIGLHLG